MKLRIRVSEDILGDRAIQDKVNEYVLPAMAEAGYPMAVEWKKDRYYFILKNQWDEGTTDAWHKAVALAFDALGLPYEVLSGKVTV